MILYSRPNFKIFCLTFLNVHTLLVDIYVDFSMFEKIFISVNFFHSRQICSFSKYEFLLITDGNNIYKELERQGLWSKGTIMEIRSA